MTYRLRPEPEGDEGMTENKDGLAALSEMLSLRRAGWHRIEGPGGSAFFPFTAKDESEWEARAITMHAAQIPVILQAKPRENIYAAKRGLTRGD